MLALFILCPLVLFTFGSTALAGESEVNVKLEQAKVKFSYGQYSDAVDLLEQVVNEDPENVEACAYLGLSQVALGRYSQGVKSFEKVMALDPSYEQGHANLAWARLKAGDADGALKDANQAVSVEPGNGFGYYVRGLAKADLGNCEQALDDFEMAADKSPDMHQAARFFTGVCYDELGQKELALQEFKEVVEIDPESGWGKQASMYIAGEITQAEPKKKRDPVAAKVSLLYQYDTNVVPVHHEDYIAFLDENLSGLDDQDDYRGVVNLDLVARPVQSNKGSVTLRYNFYSSFHDEADQMNLINHLALFAADYYGKLEDVKTRSFIAGYLSHSYLGDGPFMWYYEVKPGLEIMYTEKFMTHISTFFGKEVFQEPELLAEPYKNITGFKSYDYNRDGVTYGLNISEHFIWMDGRASLMIGFKYGTKDAEGINYDHTITGGRVGFSMQPYEDVLLIAKARYEEHDYTYSEWAEKNIIFQGSTGKVSRKDQITHISVSVEYQVTDYLSTYLGIYYIDSESNVRAFEYERTIYTIGFTGSTERVLPRY